MLWATRQMRTETQVYCKVQTFLASPLVAATGSIFQRHRITVTVQLNVREQGASVTVHIADCNTIRIAIEAKRYGACILVQMTCGKITSLERTAVTSCVA